MEAVRLSDVHLGVFIVYLTGLKKPNNTQIAWRRRECIMLSVLAVLIALGGGLQAREGWIWYKWWFQKWKAHRAYTSQQGESEVVISRGGNGRLISVV